MHIAFFFYRCPVPVPEEVSMASAVPSVGTVGGADHCVRFDGSGVLHGPLPDNAHR